MEGAAPKAGAGDVCPKIDPVAGAGAPPNKLPESKERMKVLETDRFHHRINMSGNGYRIIHHNERNSEKIRCENIPVAGCGAAPNVGAAGAPNPEGAGVPKALVV